MEKTRKINKVICPNCKTSEATEYSLTKCKSCGHVIHDFGQDLEPGWKLSVKYNEQEGQVVISGNKQGLEFLASACLSVIGKYDPGGHIHLEWQMNNLLPGSVKTLLEFSDD